MAKVFSPGWCWFLAALLLVNASAAAKQCSDKNHKNTTNEQRSKNICHKYIDKNTCMWDSATKSCTPNCADLTVMADCNTNKKKRGMCVWTNWNSKCCPPGGCPSNNGGPTCVFNGVPGCPANKGFPCTALGKKATLPCDEGFTGLKRRNCQKSTGRWGGISFKAC